MSSTVIAKNVQVGADGTASNNFTIYQPASPDGTLRIGNGNTGTTSAQVVLTSAGNVGIGTSSPAQRLDVVASDARFNLTSTGSGQTVGISIKGGAAGGDTFNFIESLSSTGSQYWYIGGGGAANALTFRTNGNNERMRIDASGNVGIGTSSPGARLDVAGTGHFLSPNAGTTGAVRIRDAAGNPDAAYIQFVNNAITSQYGYIRGLAAGGLDFNGNARIDSSGNLLVGTTDANASSGNGIKLLPNYNGTNAPSIVANTVGSANTTASLMIYSTNAGNFRFYVGDGGTVFAVSTSISAISDRTLKENIRDLETGLSEVMALKPRRFDWKNGDAKNVAGFVAQEVEDVLPDLVTDYNYSKTETKKSLRMGDILPTLVKAIQEQQQIINDLKARLDAANL